MQTQIIFSDTRYIPCKVLPGLFREHYTVHVDALHPDDRESSVQVESLVDAELVAHLTGEPSPEHSVEGWLWVSLVDINGDLAEVVLPQSSWPIGPKILVPKDCLRLPTVQWLDSSVRRLQQGIAHLCKDKEEQS